MPYLLPGCGVGEVGKLEMYGLSSAQCKELIRILSKYRSDISRAILFGSRARGDYKMASDIDIAVSLRRPILPALSADFENSGLPYTVDIVEFETADNVRLIRNIRRDGKLIYVTGEGGAVMTMEELQLKREDYGRAVEKLHAALKKDVAADDLYLDGAIQRFEFCFELAWKLLKACLSYEGVEANSPRSSIREGFKAGLLPDAEIWLEMLEARNLSAHTYDEKTAMKIYDSVAKQYILPLTLLNEEINRRISENGIA